MKRIVAVLAVLSFSTSFALADYAHPPEWDNDLNFTHQSWDFRVDNHNVDPDGVGPTVSPGSPMAMISGEGIWSKGYGSGNGGWLFSGPIELQPDEQQIMLVIPNFSNPELVKQIWLQATFQADFALDVETGAALYALANGAAQYDPKDYQLEIINAALGVARITAWIDIFPQPEAEVIKIALGVPAGKMIFIDEIDVDTRCIVPEPSTLTALVMCGFLCLIALRIRKTPC